MTEKLRSISFVFTPLLDITNLEIFSNKREYISLSCSNQDNSCSIEDIKYKFQVISQRSYIWVGITCQQQLALHASNIFLENVSPLLYIITIS